MPRHVLSEIYATRRAASQRYGITGPELTRFLKPESVIGQIKKGFGGVLRGEIPMVGMGGVIGPGRAMQVRSIARQQLARVPAPVKAVIGVGAAAGTAVAVEKKTGVDVSPAGILKSGIRAWETGRFRPGGGQRMSQGRGLKVGQELPPSHQVVRVWQTFPGGPVFARLADGHIAVQKKDGTIKHFRPYRPVVIPRKWNARSMSRVATALKRQRKTATKIMQITGGMPKSRRG